MWESTGYLALVSYLFVQQGLADGLGRPLDRDIRLRIVGVGHCDAIPGGKQRKTVNASDNKQTGLGTTHYLQQTVVKEENRVGQEKRAPGKVVRRSRSGAVVEEDSGELLPGKGGHGTIRRFSVNQSNFFFTLNPFFRLLACIPPCVWAKKDKTNVARRVVWSMRSIYSLFLL